MKIILVITDKKRRIILFILGDLRTFTPQQIVPLVEKGEIPDVHVVRRKSGLYIRSNPNAAMEDNLGALSVPFPSLGTFKGKRPGGAFANYLRAKNRLYQEKEQSGEKIILINGERAKTVKEVTQFLRPYRSTILSAAKRYAISPYLLGGILIDEFCRLDFGEQQVEWAASWVADLAGKKGNISVGIAQVKLETARSLIKKGYYNPDLRDPGLSQRNIGRASRRLLYEYASAPVHSIFFAAATIRSIIREAPAHHLNLSRRPDLIGAFYSAGLKDMDGLSKASMARGNQIVREFLPLAKKILSR